MIDIENKTIAQVYDELLEILKEDGIYGEIEYFNPMNNQEKELFPYYNWVSCFAVEGGSEGHYVHVEVINRVGDRILLYLGKTLEGIDHALKLSNVLTKAFYR